MPLQASDFVRIKQKLQDPSKQPKERYNEVLGRFNIIWPSFTLPAAEQELPAAVKSETLTHKKEHTIGLKMPLGDFTSNLRSFR